MRDHNNPNSRISKRLARAPPVRGPPVENFTEGGGFGATVGNEDTARTAFGVDNGAESGLVGADVSVYQESWKKGVADGGSDLAAPSTPQPAAAPVSGSGVGTAAGPTWRSDEVAPVPASTPGDTGAVWFNTVFLVH
jgi:hypothetical protein